MVDRASGSAERETARGGGWSELLRSADMGRVCRRGGAISISVGVGLGCLLGLMAGEAAAREPVDVDVPWVLRPAEVSPRGVDHPVTPGVLFLAMDGVELRRFCGAAEPQVANGALNCTPLVDEEVSFPAWGSDVQRLGLLQKLNEMYAPYDLVISHARPPDWLPYTMAVVGGDASLVGASAGVCGLANVACDGAKRNHVSLTFPENCPDAVAAVAAQETAHNWGLEHVTAQSDIMYPFTAVGAPSFRDECTPVSNATGSPTTSCPYVHRAYCPEGDGEEQNGHAELLGVFGPRTTDETPPKIVETTPRSGDVWTTADTFPITARFEEASGYLAVRWTWTEGAPAELDVGDDELFTSCTNGVCDLGFGLWKDPSEFYEFVVFTRPPAGEYAMLVEAMDAQGHYAARELRFTVVEGASPSETGTPGDGTGDVETGPAWTANASGGGDGDGTESGEGDEDVGCGCRSDRPRAPGGRTSALWILLTLAATARRRPTR